jgi:RNA polymerase sigma factor (sigma-70 family)
MDQKDVLDNMELVRKIAYFMKARHTNSLMDVDDLVSEGIFGLSKAFELYDPDKSSFKTFASRKIKYAMMEAHRSLFPQFRQSRRFGLPEPTYLHLDDNDGEEFLEGAFLSEEEIVDTLDAALVLVEPWKKLTYRQRHIIKLMRRGLTQGEVSEVLKISPSIVCIQYNKALDKIRNYHANHRRL